LAAHTHQAVVVLFVQKKKTSHGPVFTHWMTTIVLTSKHGQSKVASMSKLHTLNQTEFADHMGWSKGYVTQLKQAGRIVFAENGKVDVEASKLLINQTEDPNRDDVKQRHADDRGADTKVNEIGKPKKEKEIKDPNRGSFSEARAKEQKFKALEAELDYEIRIGKYVARDDMQAAIADMVTTFRQNLENFPHHISAELVGKDITAIRQSLKHAINHELQKLVRGCEEKLNQRAEVNQ
jgi:hypothetical protein